MQEQGRPRKYKTPQELKGKVDAYFTYCEVQGKPKTMAGLAHALGMDRRSLVNYKDRDEYKEILEEARRELEAYAEEILLSGGKNVAGVIFSLKNNYAWQDDRNINQNINTTFSLSQLHEAARLKQVENIKDAPIQLSTDDNIDQNQFNSTQNALGEENTPNGANVPIEEKSSV